jgi:hypothetical protein
MDKDQREVFDKKMGERQDRVQGDMEGRFNKFQEAMKGTGDMTDDQKKKFMKEGMDEMKMQGARDQKFEDHDFSQMIKNKYFNMGESERKNYDEKDDKMRKERKGNFDEMDKKMGDFKKSGKFDDMSDDDKKKFMGNFSMQMGSNMQ